MIVGGAEMATTPVGVGGFGAARALSSRNEDPAAASRPWDKDRDGFVLVMVHISFREYEFAKKGGKNLCRIIWFRHE